MSVITDFRQVFGEKIMIFRQSYLQILLLALMLFMLTVFAMYLLKWQYAQAVNQTITQLATQAVVDEQEVDLSQPENQFAYAFYLQQHQQFEEAIDAYGKAENSNTNPEMLHIIYYNLGNLYLEQAIESAEKMHVDHATALADVAKQMYRTSLGHTPDFWLAKYNYEAAQRLSRDLPLGKLIESEEGQESSTELWSAMPGFPVGLP